MQSDKRGVQIEMAQLLGMLATRAIMGAALAQMMVMGGSCVGAPVDAAIPEGVCAVC